MTLITAVASGVALLIAAICIWQDLWPKAQCWLLVIAGANLGGIAGDGIAAITGGADDVAASTLQTIIGVALPSLISYLALLVFTLDMLPNRVAATKPVGWHTRIVSVLVVPAIATIPGLTASLRGAASGAVNTTIAAIALTTVAYFLWQNLWPKAQCWLLVAAGWGMGGLLGNILTGLLGEANNFGNEALRMVFGVAVPGLVAVAALMIFVIGILPTKLAASRPVGWHTRIAALVLPASITSIPVLAGSLTAAGG